MFDKEKGDVKPIKLKKKVPLAKKAGNSLVQKRSFSEVDVCKPLDYIPDMGVQSRVFELSLLEPIRPYISNDC